MKLSQQQILAMFKDYNTLPNGITILYRG